MGKWIIKTDTKGNQVLINPKAAWILDYSFNLDEHLAELYAENTKAITNENEVPGALFEKQLVAL